MANLLKTTKKENILDHLVEGCGIRPTSRLCKVHRDTVLKVLMEAGEKCKDFMEEKIQNFKTNFFQADEIWTFVYKKDKQLTEIEKLKDKTIGSQYVYVGMCADTKFIPCYLVGKRTKKNTFDFIKNLKNSLEPGWRMQLTTDGYAEYECAVRNIFDDNIDYAQTIKHQGKKDDETGKYVITISDPVLIKGKPVKDKISTSFIERQNLTMRMSMRRFTRLTNGFSKKFENLEAAIALHLFHYNFIKKHMTLGMTPAQASGISSRPFFWSDLF